NLRHAPLPGSPAQVEALGHVGNFEFLLAATAEQFAEKAHSLILLQMRVSKPKLDVCWHPRRAYASTLAKKFVQCSQKSMIRATSVRRSFRATTRSTKPCLSKNSLVWKPCGNSSRTVFQMVRFPAKPIMAPGSARVMSPCKAKLAATPPMVGSVRMA